jgi:sugar phosphate isomerase/epimerase
MEIGIFAKTFERDSLAGVLDAVFQANLGTVQFNMICALGSSLPEFIEPTAADRICRACSQRQIKMAAVSGTCNLVHPDPDQRQTGINRVKTLIESCDELGTSLVTLCTGSRDADNMWRHHPDNDMPQAWLDMMEAFNQLLPVAEEHDVTLGVEPELANVVNSAQKAKQLIDELGSSYVKIIMDGANLLTADQMPQMNEILSESIGLLAEDIVIAHAKDIDQDPAVGHVAAGEGCLDYDHYLACLKSVGFEGPLILHGLSEAQVSQSVSFLESKLSRIKV